MGTKGYWHEAMVSRFHGREDIGKEGLNEQSFAPEGMPECEVLECLELIEMPLGKEVNRRKNAKSTTGCKYKSPGKTRRWATTILIFLVSLRSA